LEYKFLSSWNSTFTEKFYGLKRTSLNKFQINDYENKISEIIQSKKRLNKWQIISIVLINVGVKTYMKEKLDILYERNLPLVLTKKLDNKSWKYWFVKVYPIMSSFFKLIDVFYQILYLSGRTKSPTLTDSLLKVEYSRLNQFDYDLHEKKSLKSPGPLTMTSNSTKRPPTYGQHLTTILARYYSPLKAILANISTTIFPSAIFLLKFLEWWNSSEFASKLVRKQQNAIDKDIPPPKVSPGFGSEAKLQPSQNSAHCPICQKLITNPAVIETGYVFCYPCIYNHLSELSKQEGGRCPVTGVRLLGCRYLNESKSWKVDGIRRLMI
jgi:peroxin-12